MSEVDVVKVVSIHRPKITVGRGETIATSSNMEIRADGKLLVSLHYDYGYMDNSSQWSLGRQIAEAMFPNCEIEVMDFRVTSQPPSA